SRPPPSTARPSLRVRSHTTGVTTCHLSQFRRRQAPAPGDSAPTSADPLEPDVRPQRLGNDNGAVGLLVVLENRNERSADGQARAVERVGELVLPAAGRPVANLRPPRLERLRIAARRDLAILALARQPYLDVERLGRG